MRAYLKRRWRKWLWGQLPDGQGQSLLRTFVQGLDSGIPACCAFEYSLVWGRYPMPALAAAVERGNWGGGEYLQCRFHWTEGRPLDRAKYGPFIERNRPGAYCRQTYEADA